VIEAHGLTKRYGPITAVDQLSFDVRPGVVTGFLGPNGSGKSTTMRLILGLDAADHGTVKVAGRAYHDLPFPLREVGALPEVRAFHPARSARAHLQALAASNAIPRSRVDQTLQLVGLGSAGQHGAGQHGAGQHGAGQHGAAGRKAVAVVFVAPLAGLAATPASKFIPELIYANSLGATKPVQGFTFSPWAGLAIIAAYAVVLLAVGGWLLTRRDA
jgi:ABC-type Na+ transport system ATPase subunit NatA